MGVYVYSLRKKQTPIYINGDKTKANHFEYAYKCSYSGEIDGGEYGRSYRFRASNTERRAEDAFHDYDGEGYVITGAHEGAAVYKNVTDSLWYDTGDFPGEYVGHLTKFGPWWLVEDNNGNTI